MPPSYGRLPTSRSEVLINGLARLVRRVVLAPSEWVASGDVIVKGGLRIPADAGYLSKRIGDVNG